MSLVLIQTRFTETWWSSQNIFFFPWDGMQFPFVNANQCLFVVHLQSNYLLLLNKLRKEKPLFGFLLQHLEAFKTKTLWSVWSFISRKSILRQNVTGLQVNELYCLSQNLFRTFSYLHWHFCSSTETSNALMPFFECQFVGRSSQNKTKETPKCNQTITM